MAGELVTIESAVPARQQPQQIWTFGALQTAQQQQSGGFSMANVGLGALSSLGGIAAGLILSPLTFAAASELATYTGIGSAGHKRGVNYEQNRNVANAVPGPDQMIGRFNQYHWVNGAPTISQINWLRASLANHGIDPAIAGWQHIISSSHKFAPLDTYLLAYRRQTQGPDGNPLVPAGDAISGLERQLDLSMIQGMVDRELVVNPPYAWSPTDAMRMFAGGLIGGDQYPAMLAGAGLIRPDDVEMAITLSSALDGDTVLALNRRGVLNDDDAKSALGLSGVVSGAAQDAAMRFQWRGPTPETILTSAVRSAFDERMAARYGLDEGMDDYPLVRYWMQAYGLVGPQGSPEPGPHDGPTDWMKYYWRGAHPVIGFEVAATLQHRLRPDPLDPANSVVPGMPAWTVANTLDSLAMSGYSETQAEWLVGLIYEPLNIRLINHVLAPLATHPNVAAAAEQNLGHQTDWVEGAMLDHGLSPGLAKVAAAGILAQADDHFHEERISEQRKLDKDRRDLVLKRYSGGFINRQTVLDLAIGEQFTDAMAIQAMNIIDGETELAIATANLAAIREGFMSGKLSLDQVSAQMTALGISDFMKISYVQEWAWKRTDNPRMLSTGEILAALKRGLMTPQVALARLKNLGWSQPDALVEIAQIEAELAAAAQHQQSAAAAKAIALKLKEDRAAATAVQAAEREAAKSARAAEKAKQAAERVPLESAAGVAKYDATALLDWDAYNKAVSKGDKIKAQAEIDKAQAAYVEELLSQLKLRQENPSVASEVIPAEPVLNPSPSKGTGTSPPSAGTPPTPG